MGFWVRTSWLDRHLGDLRVAFMRDLQLSSRLSKDLGAFQLSSRLSIDLGAFQLSSRFS